MRLAAADEKYFRQDTDALLGSACRARPRQHFHKIDNILLEDCPCAKMNSEKLIQPFMNRMVLRIAFAISILLLRRASPCHASNM